MAGITVRFKSGPITHTAEAAVTGGQVVQAGTGNRSVVPAAADSAKILGVALTDAAPKPAPGALPVGQLYVGTDQVAVACAPAVVPIASDDSAAVGDLVVVGTGSGVKKAGATPAAGSIVGRVIEKLDDTANTVLVRIGG